MNISDRIALHREARESIAAELTAEVWSLPAKKAERLEAYEARVTAIVDSICSSSYVTPHATMPVAATEQPAQPEATAVEQKPQVAAPASEADEPNGKDDMKDELDDGAELF